MIVEMGHFLPTISTTIGDEAKTTFRTGTAPLFLGKPGDQDRHSTQEGRIGWCHFLE